ncbi:hypothetical protein DSM02_305 [Leeuwenhoekiella polynyae]|uniref:Uncharacterized protein n=1 Tax=Leeuwenhoekiella polynyae TaxID=1550906 RepID=A0A4Q0PHZ8_9FLAO|nr:hypothetical protein DSM02_305 [Leeuwenhoekiella polynyae]
MRDRALPARKGHLKQLIVLGILGIVFLEKVTWHSQLVHKNRYPDVPIALVYRYHAFAMQYPRVKRG